MRGAEEEGSIVLVSQSTLTLLRMAGAAVPIRPCDALWQPRRRTDTWYRRRDLSASLTRDVCRRIAPTQGPSSVAAQPAGLGDRERASGDECSPRAKGRVP